VTSHDEAVEAVRQVLGYLEEYHGAKLDPDVIERTPHRWIAFLEDATRGMREPESTAARFELVDSGMVKLSDVTFHSLCEHHLLPFFGAVSIEYRPTQFVVGISALVHIVERHAHRLQLQERMTRDIANEIAAATSSHEVRVMIEAEHLCMSMRGVAKPGTTVTTNVEVAGVEFASVESTRTSHNIPKDGR